MGAADLKAEFNRVAQPGFTCVKAMLDYVRAGGESIEYQVLQFNGMRAADSTAFSVTSERLPANSDLMAATRVVAQKLVDGSGPQS